VSRRLSRIGVLGALALAGLGCARLPSNEVPKEQRDELKLSHERHAKVECQLCHGRVLAATSLYDSARPTEEDCMYCHEEQRESEDCAWCHTDVRYAKEAAAARRSRAKHVRINHAAHVERIGGNCHRCHGPLSEPETRPAPAPLMEKCLGCHEHDRDYASANCQRCHLELDRDIVGFSHGVDFVVGHRVTARSRADVCASCHDQTFCADCHAKTVATRIELKFPESVERNFIHRGDFRSRHFVEARGYASRCQRCHGTSFCESCHRLNNLTPSSAAPNNRHPMGWLSPSSPSFHGLEARRDITSCATCHDQGPDSNCIECHAVGRIGGNPHPPSWQSRHDVNEIADNPMCKYCHL
jgi:hypothetical protein